MDEDQRPPLTLKERMAMLQASSAASSSSRSSSQTTGPAPAAVKAGVASADDSHSTKRASATRAEDVLVAELRDATTDVVPPPAASQKGSDALSAYPPLSPTLSNASSRPASPYMPHTSAYDSLADQSNRRRAGSTASALSALSNVSRESGERKGLELEMGELNGSSDRPSTKAPAASATEASAARSDTKDSQMPTENSLMAFSPTIGKPEDSLPPGSAAPTVSSRIPKSPPTRRSTVASTSSQSSSAPSLPPRLPPRRSQSTVEPPSPTASSFSIASSASSQGPALPPRPRPAQTGPTATPPRPSASNSSLSATPTGPRPAYARHSPKARQDGFESVSLTSAGGAELAQSLASTARPQSASAPTISHPLSSPSGSFSSLPSGPRSVTGRQRPMDPRARKRYDALFEKCLRKAEGGAPRPAWVESNGEGQHTLEGSVVRGIWMRSRLNSDVLRGIWATCDGEQKGTIDREGFLKGMWMIDEELRRVQRDRS